MACENRQMKSIIDFDLLRIDMSGKTFPRLKKSSGKSPDEIVGSLLYERLSAVCKGDVFWQYKCFNSLYDRHLDADGEIVKRLLFEFPTVLFLFTSVKSIDARLLVADIVSDRYCNTADILAVEDGFFNIIDVKMRNLGKNDQPPNIISAYKLAQLCAKMIDNEDFDVFTIDYFGVDWRLIGDSLVCEDAHHANLFKANPSSLYINWAAAMQIQFHVSECDQSFTGGMHEWAKSYLCHFVEEARARVKYMDDKYIAPFVKYVG